VLRRGGALGLKRNEDAVAVKMQGTCHPILLSVLSRAFVIQHSLALIDNILSTHIKKCLRHFSRRKIASPRISKWCIMHPISSIANIQQLLVAKRTKQRLLDIHCV